MSALRIRSGGPRDLGVLLALGREMQAESRTAFPAPETAALARHLALAAANPGLYRILLAERVAEDATEAVGFAAGGISPYAFSPERRAFCEFLFVRPAARGGTAALRLLRAFCGWADGEGAASVWFGVSTGVHAMRTGAFLEADGFRPLGRIYRKELRACAPESNP
jgi:GNAT superfamily N-acetyltransferase